MTISEKSFKQIQRDIEELKQRLDRLERGGNDKQRATTRKHKLSQRDRVRDTLRRAGLLAELTPEEKAMAAEWRSLSEEEKRRVRDQLWNLKLEKPLSQIIIENR